MTNKEKALLTYKEIQKRKIAEQKKKEVEITLYHIDNIRKIRRRIN